MTAAASNTGATLSSHVSLTVRNITTLGPGLWWDETLGGFYLRVSPPSRRWPKGVRAYGLWYRVAGRGGRVALGRHPIVSLGDARARAREILNAAQLRREDIGKRPHADDLAGLWERFLEDYDDLVRKGKRSADTATRLPARPASAPQGQAAGAGSRSRASRPRTSSARWPRTPRSTRPPRTSY